LFTARFVGVSMAIRPYPLSPPAAPSPGRTHPPYIKRFRAICPAP
jgi:hypothetical protein